MMHIEKYKAVDVSFVELLAKKIAKVVKPPIVIALHGDLGVGKTAFAKFFINTLLPDEVVSSPTFNIINRYNTCNFVIWHLDLYRIKDLDELYDIGVEEVLNAGIAIVEWPELIKKLTVPDIEININYNDDKNDLRDIIIQTKSEKRRSYVTNIR
ncbi:MAG: tRNA (adenosine(37)-N6)-threonylcarbamoyltransferase complex ATPase subunit type 1 TsaE [Wolbachia endosymbiont of Xenopsylla cheopis]